ncbi:MAG: anaerobic ribonucleoside-triphosphate reductase, partial [Clostridia bacterium]|nr:anaerobic ribonucleoside-triphosphate reductase [Clostridia bacterium]
QSVKNTCGAVDRALSVEEIQDLVENGIMQKQAFKVARKYIKYRYNRALIRKSNTTDEQILSLIECNNEEVKQENSNKNPTVNSVQRDYMAGEVSKDITKRILLPNDIVEAHEQGLIHFHDADYFAQHMHNCDLVNLEDMLQNGTVISGTFIEKPHSFSTACNIATQIIAQVASNQYGGQSISLTHLAPFVQISREKLQKQVAEEFAAIDLEISEEKLNKIVEKRLREEVSKGVQTIQYQVVTLLTTNGQAPFVTVFMYLNEAKTEQEKADLALIIEETLKQRYRGVKNEEGVWITPAFPKLIYVLEEDNIKEGTRFWYLTKLAAKCTAKRMVPDYISEKIMLKNKIDKNGNGNCYTCMGCRSFLTPYVDENGNAKYYGRFNQGVVTVNLVDIGLSANKDMEKFWQIFDERMELCHRALQCRHERLTGTLSDAAPILWQYGALARLKKGETIDSLLHGGYSTISLGFAGLWECVYALNGKKLTEPEGEELGLEIMKKLNEYTAKWKAAENIDYSLYGTPLESTTYKFSKCLQARFGIVEGVTDKNYITNSYHVHVTEPIDAFDKLALESKFQALSPGGAISYVEVPNMQDNLEAVLSVMQYIYENIMYAELNTKSDYCQECGFDGEIEVIKDDHGKLIWRCPKCGNTDQAKMNVARRTCGYIGTQYWNQGRTQEIKERVLHL